MLYDAVKKLSKHSVIYAIGPTIHKASGFLLMPLVTHYIGGRENYGVKEIAEVTLVISAQILGINLLNGMTRYYHSYEKSEDRACLISTSVMLLASTTGAALLLTMMFARPAARLVFGSESFADAIRAVVVILFFQCLGQTGLRYLQILHRSAVYGFLTVSKLFLEIALKVFFLVTLGMTYMGVLYSVLVGEVLLGLGLGVGILIHLRPRFSWAMARRLTKYSTPLILSGLCMFILHQADRFVLRIVFGEAGLDQVGLYGVCYKFGSMVNALVLASFGLIWFPYIFSIDSEDEVRIICRKILTYFMLISTFASLVIAVFSREIISLMADPEYHESYRMVPVILAGYLFWAIYQIVHTSYFIKEKTGQASMLVAMAAVVNLSLNFLLVPRLGYAGAAWTTLITFFILAVVTQIASERLFPVHYEIRRIVIPMALGGALFGISALVPPAPLHWVLLAKTGLVILFPGILLAGGYLTPPERVKLREVLTAGVGSVIRRLGRSSGR